MPSRLLNTPFPAFPPLPPHRLPPPPPPEAPPPTFTDPPFELFHLPSPFSPGEVVRLAFAEGSEPYVNHFRENTGYRAEMRSLTAGDDFNPPAYTEPILRHGPIVIGDVPSIMLYLAPLLGLGVDPKLTAPPSRASCPAAVYHMNQMCNVLLKDCVGELEFLMRQVFQVDRPEKSMDSLKKTFAKYVTVRLPEVLDLMEDTLSGPNSHGGSWLFGHRFSYADIVMFYTIDLLLRIFPKSIAVMRKTGECDNVFVHLADFLERPRIKKYLLSGARHQGWKQLRQRLPRWDEIDAYAASKLRMPEKKEDKKPVRSNRRDQKLKLLVSVQPELAEYMDGAGKKAQPEDDGLFSGFFRLISPCRSPVEEMPRKIKPD